VNASPIEPQRLQTLNRARCRPDGEHVLYWMQGSQREAFNPALEHAIHRANELSLPLRVVFALTADYPEANLRHFRFMLEGLRETARHLGRRGIRFEIEPGDPAEVALRASRRAALVVCDRGYLPSHRAWRETLTQGATCLVEQVEGDVVVPVEVASERPEVAARTLRPRLLRHLSKFLKAVPRQEVAFPLEPGPELDVEGLLATMTGLDRSVAPVERHFTGGPDEARRRFEEFLERGLAAWQAGRNHPHTDHVSQMSPYLHFGQVSPTWLALRAEEAAGPNEQDALNAFLEQLVVRRELAFNHAVHNPTPTLWQGLPGWARQTLMEHRADPRAALYTEEQLLEARTHDPYWNAAMLEMRHTGYMHNYMRMYWGKKILEWTSDPEEAWARTLQFNNRFLLDGRDPVSWGSVGWVFGLHDRPWPSRPVFGTVRSMTAGGLERKTDPRAYVLKVQGRLAGEAPPG